MNNGRASNLELLRIVCILMIVFSHLTIHGIWNYTDTDNRFLLWNMGCLLNKLITCFFVPGSGVGVALFFMITGYFLADIKSKEVKPLIQKTCIFSFICIVLYGLSLLAFGYNSADLHGFISLSIRSIFNPISGGIWWYVSTYTIILILLPKINQILSILVEKFLYNKISCFCNMIENKFIMMCTTKNEGDL